MFIIVFFTTVLLFSLCLNAYYKIKAYNHKDRTIWQEGDSVRVQGKEGEARNDGFMRRIA